MEAQASEFYEALFEPVFQQLLLCQSVDGIFLLHPDGSTWMTYGQQEGLDPALWEHYTAYSLDQEDFILLPPAATQAPQFYCWSWPQGALFIMWEPQALLSWMVQQGQATVQELRSWLCVEP